MALPKQTVPISFFKGIDTKTDNKNSVPGELLIAENAVFTNPGKIKKRNGFTSLPTTSGSGNISVGKAISSYNNEPVVFTDNQVFGYSDTEQAWTNRGIDYSLSSSTKSIVNNNSEQKNPEVCIAEGLEVYVWEDSSGGIRYSVIDGSNGSVLVANALIDFFGYRPKIVFWNGNFQITYISTNQIYIRNIDPAKVFIVSKPYLYASTSIINHLDPTGPQYDVAVNDGYNQFYIANSFSGATVISVVEFTGTNYDALTYVAMGSESELSLGIFIDSSSFVWVLCGSASTGFNIGGVFLEDLESIVSVIVLQKNTVNVLRCMGYQNDSSGNIVIIYEVEQMDSFDSGNIIYKALVGPVETGGRLFSNTVFKRGLGLYSKPFNISGDYFFELTYDTPLQATYYLFDESGVVINRTNVNNGGGNKNNSNDGFNCGMCTNIQISSGGRFVIPFQFKTTIESNNNVTYLPTGINAGTFDFNATNVFGNVFSSDNINVVGGIFKNYDGINYVENNFLVYPEVIGSFYDQTVVEISTPGTGTSSEVIIFSFVNGWQFIANSYVTFSSTTSEYFAWFRIDGVGIQPTASGTSIVVDINTTDTKEQVADKFGIAVSNFDFSVGISENSAILTNNAFGPSLSPPTVGNTDSGNIAVGTYLYSVIYSWVDNNGVVQHSQTSVPITVNVTIDQTNVALIIPTLRITGKTNVRIGVYRTEGTNQGSSIFYRVTPIGGILNNPSIDWISFIDTNSDDSILANDILYTAGGVLDNTSPPSSSMLVLYKNRIFIGGLDDRNLLWFSKYIFEGIPTQFSEFLTIKVDPFGGNITALGVLDDKLIIFKDSVIFALTGNGPTDTGDNNDYDSGTVRISTDIGCSESNSIVITPQGLMFKSHKGIYLLGRDLSTQHIGAGVEDFNSFAITSAVLSPNNNQVRFTTSNGPMLVYDYYVGQWATFTGLEAADAHFINQTYYLLRNSGIVFVENQDVFTDNGAFIKLRLQTGWMTFAGIQGFERIQRVAVLGTYKGSHTLQISFSYDYQNSPSYFTQINATILIGENEPWGSEDTWGEVGTVWGGSFVPYNFRTHLTKQKCTAIQITLEDLQTDNFGEGFDISNLNLIVGVKSGANKLPGKNSFGNS